MILYGSSNAYYDNYISRFDKMLRTFEISTSNYEGIECQTVPQKSTFVMLNKMKMSVFKESIFIECGVHFGSIEELTRCQPPCLGIWIECFSPSTFLDLGLDTLQPLQPKRMSPNVTSNL